MIMWVDFIQSVKGSKLKMEISQGRKNSAWTTSILVCLECWPALKILDLPIIFLNKMSVTFFLRVFSRILALILKLIFFLHTEKDMDVKNFTMGTT